MSDLFEVLAPYLDAEQSPSISTDDAQTRTYLNSLSTLSLADLTSKEPTYLSQTAQSHVRNLQALSKKSYKAVISSGSHISNLGSLLPSLSVHTKELRDAVPELDTAAGGFAQKYDRSQENAVLDRRKRAMLLSRNADRVADVLDLPTLLSTTIAAGQVPSSSAASTAAMSYASALDLHAHIKRLHTLYPDSRLVSGISEKAEGEMANLTTALITALQSPSLKLTTAMRTIGFLRRVAPDFTDDFSTANKSAALSTKSLDFSGQTGNSDGALGALFLVCRLQTLHATLETLEPLQELADQETTRRQQATNGSKQQHGFGSHSERYLKRYIEIFREQSFNMISMYKSIFPNALPRAGIDSEQESGRHDTSPLALPSSLASFSLHVVELLMATLREYLPNVTEKSARESLLTQVLYCAGSLGRSGADFGMMLALLAEESSTDHVVGSTEGERDEAEWVQVMKKHRIQTGRLEVLARGVGSGGHKTSMDVSSPPQSATATG